MTDCQRCAAKSDLFLCGRCQTTLASTLTDLPWWLDRLTETALGQTRMADNGGRKSARRKDLDGDTELAACIETLPTAKDDDLDKARNARQKAALAHALATGGINAKASELLATIADSLGYWVRVLCEARGIGAVEVAGGSHGTPAARWLRRHVTAIAASEDAGDICTDIGGHLEDIVEVVNRPVRWWTLGECPGTDEPCGRTLRVPADTEEVRCRDCGSRHNVHRLLLARKAEAEANPMTRRQLVRYNADLPPEFQVPPRTLRHWLESGRLCACAEIAGDPLYSWVDVRLLMLDSRHASVRKRGVDA